MRVSDRAVVTRYQYSFGMATLEAVAILFIGLPLIISTFAIYEILDTSARLEQLSRGLISKNQIKPLKLGTGDQLWVLRPLDYGSNGTINAAINDNPAYGAALEAHHNTLTAIAAQAEHELQILLGTECDQSCQELYRVELRMIDFNVDRKTGHLRAEGIWCPRSKRGCQNGSFADLTEGGHSQHRYLRVRGSLDKQSTDFKEYLLNLKNYPALVTELGTPSGLHAASRNQYYGESPTLAGNQVINFSPVARVIGLKLSVDFKGRLAGKFLQLLRFAKSTVSGKLAISEIYKFYQQGHPGVSSILTVQNYVIPRNDV